MPKTLRFYNPYKFSPLSLSPALWLDASDLTTLFQDRTGASASTPVASDSDPVGTWKDKSGNARHVIAMSDAQRVTYKTAVQNGKSGLLSDGTDDRMRVSAITITPYTIVTVTKASTSIGNRSMFDYRISGLVVHRMGTNAFTSHNNSNSLNVSTVIDPTQSLILTTVFDSTEVRQYVNGAAGNTDAGTRAMSGSGDLYIFAGPPNIDHYAGYIFELLAFPEILSDANRLLVHQYLASKWGITLA